MCSVPAVFGHRWLRPYTTAWNAVRSLSALRVSPLPGASEECWHSVSHLPLGGLIPHGAGRTLGMGRLSTSCGEASGGKNKYKNSDDWHRYPRLPKTPTCILAPECLSKYKASLERTSLFIYTDICICVFIYVHMCVYMCTLLSFLVFSLTVFKSRDCKVAESYLCLKQ